MIHRSALTMLLAVALTSAACSNRHDDPIPPTSTTGASPSGTVQSESVEAIDCVGPLTRSDTHRYRADVDDYEADLVSLDVHRRPGGSGCPVIVWVHGGGWAVGDKSGNAIKTKVRFAGELGAVLVSVNYRLVEPGGDIRWPVMGQDVAAGVSWVIEHAGDLGIDPSHVALMGHSAGAHLVSIVATNPSLLGDAGESRDLVRCVVSLDTTAYDITPAEVRIRPLYARAFGNDPATLADASPTVQANRHPEGLPDFLVVTRGSRSRVAESRAFVDIIGASGATAHLIDAGGYSHGEVNTELGVASDDVVTPPTRSFLRSCLASP